MIMEKQEPDAWILSRRK